MPTKEPTKAVLAKQAQALGVLTRALTATLLDASGKGDETAIIFTVEQLQQAESLALEVQPLEDGTVAVILQGLTEQKEDLLATAQAESVGDGIDVFEDPALD